MNTPTGRGAQLKKHRENFNFTFTLTFTVSIPGLGHMQLPIQGVPGAFTSQFKRPEREAHNSPPSSVEVKNM
jgi:hypothetical protein